MRKSLACWFLLACTAAAASVAGAVPSAPFRAVDVSFARGKWNPAEFSVVRSPRLPYAHAFEQRDDAIVNPCPDVSGEEIQRKYGDRVYAAMVHTNRFDFGHTVSSTMSWDYRMAPIIVLASEFAKAADGTPEFREHWEVCLYDEGINVWHHLHDGTKPYWYKAAAIRFRGNTRYRANERLELRVCLRREKGHKRMTVTCGEYELTYVDDSLPDTYRAGVIGCEGRNFFYDFRVRE